VVTDDSTENIGKRFYESLIDLGWNADIDIMVDRRKSGEEPDPGVAANMLNYSLVFCLTKHSLTHTVARRKANEKGISVITMPGMKEDIFVNGSINIDYEKVEHTTLDIRKTLSNYAAVTIKTGELELYTTIGDRKGVPSTGVFRKLGDFGNLPSG